MTQAHLTPWPLAARDLPERSPRPGLALPAAMIMTTLDDSRSIVPMFWHGGLAFTQRWLRYDGIRPPAAGWRILPDGDWELSIELDNDPWAASQFIEYHLTPPERQRTASCDADGALASYGAVLADALAQPTEPAVFCDDLPVLIPGAYDLISVHVPLAGTTYRILEQPALETADGSIRARRARVLRDDAPLAREGFLYWCDNGDGTVQARYWPDGSHPALDAPLTSHPLIDAMTSALAAAR